MRILSPLTCVSEVEPLIHAGADEFYCGVMSSAWRKGFFSGGSLNANGASKANFSSFEDLKEAVEIANTYEVPMFMTLNAQGYSKYQITAVLESAERAANIGIKGLIVADPGMIKAISNKGIPIDLHVSTLGAIFNSKTIEFYRDLGASRIVLPKELTLEEVSALARGSGVETEVFVLNGLCHNIEGFCTLQHAMLRSSGAGRFSNDYESLLRIFGRFPKGLAHLILSHTSLRYSAGCALSYNVRRLKGSSSAALSAASSWQRIGAYLDSCALCSIPDFLDAGVDVLKFESRFFSIKKKLSDIAFIKSCRDFAVSRPSREEFRDFAMQQYTESHGFKCNSSNCYPYVNAV